MKKYFIHAVILFSLFLGLNVYAEVSINSGFIPGQIWYSKEPLKEGETVNIYTAIWNGESSNILVKVEFYDKNVILGSRDISINSLELKDVFIPWKVTSGDHIISAKIISSTSAIGNKEKIILSRDKTSNDKQSIPVIVKDSSGVPISEKNPLKSQIDKTSSDIQNIIPTEVGDLASEVFTFVDDFRNNTFIKVNEIKEKAKDEISLIKNEPKTIKSDSIEKSNIQESINKPLTYLKLYLFSILYFILKSKIVFYILLVLIIFYILRFIYRKIRHR